METKRELQVACLWGLHDLGVHELRKEIIAQSPGTQVTYLLNEEILVVKGSFNDSSRAALVACIKAYVEKHMHHNLLDEEPRIRLIVKIDVGAALDSRGGQKYGTAPPLTKELDVQSNKSSLASTTTSAPPQVSRNWTPSIVKFEYFSKDPHRMLGRVAVATGTNHSFGHSEANEVFIRVSANAPEKVEDAFQILKKLDNLLALLDIPCQACTTFVPYTKGLRLCLLELAHLNDVAPGRILLDPNSPNNNKYRRFYGPCLLSYRSVYESVPSFRTPA